MPNLFLFKSKTENLTSYLPLPISWNHVERGLGGVLKKLFKNIINWFSSSHGGRLMLVIIVIAVLLLAAF
jgi:hypothetical protein